MNIINPYRFGAYTDDPGTYGLTFDGVAGRVGCGSDSSIANVFDGGGSMVARIKVASDGEGDFGRVWDKRDASGSGHTLITLSESAGFCKLRFLQDFSTQDGRWDTTSADVELGTWITVAVVYNADSATNDAKIYIDGVESSVTEALTPSGTRASDISSNLRLGNLISDRTFDGVIDWVRIYDKELSTVELQDISALSGNLVEAWELEENTGTTTAAEISSPTNDGTLSSSPTWTTV